jgi:hypothetical protein
MYYFGEASGGSLPFAEYSTRYIGFTENLIHTHFTTHQEI